MRLESICYVPLFDGLGSHWCVSLDLETSTDGSNWLVHEIDIDCLFVEALVFTP